MISIPTIENRSYVATVTAAATITDAATGILLASTEKASQIAFLAIGEKTTISDDRAVVVAASFKGASLGSSAGGGSDASLVADMVADGVASAIARAQKDVHVLATADGACENECDAVTLAARHLRPGFLRSLTLTAAERAEKSACYLAVQERDASDRNWSLLGFSINKQATRQGLDSVWEFDDLALSGRALRFIARPDTADAAMTQLHLLHLRAGISPEGDASSITYDYVEYPYLAHAAVHVAVPGNGWARADDLNAHARNAAAHVTDEDRARWDDNAKSYVTVVEDDGNSSPSAIGHPGVTRSMTLTSSMWGDQPQIHLVHEGAETATYGSWELSYRPVLDETKAVSITLPQLIEHPSDASAHVSAVERGLWNGSRRARETVWDKERSIPGPEDAEGLAQSFLRISFTATSQPGEINLDTMLAAYRNEALSGRAYCFLLVNETGARCAFTGNPSCRMAAATRADAAILPGEERLLTVHVFGSLLYCTLGDPFFQ